MGLNWSEGLAGASEGLAKMGEVAFRRELQEAEAARAENLERLRQANQLDRDKQNHTQALELQDRADGRADARIKASDERADAREKGQDRRLAARERASDDRLDRRLALDGEKYARSQTELRLERVRDDERAAAADLLKYEAEAREAQTAYEAAKLSAEPGKLNELAGALNRAESMMAEARRRQLAARQQIGQWNQRIRPDVGTAMREEAAGGPPPLIPPTTPGLTPVPRESRSRFSDALSAGVEDDPLIPRR